ncbi:MAG: PIG-L deacetylase family protein [Anaerolineae bacterium]|nr:PIG-L deacetylase family protein [Anaerolineae bacterium]
MSERRLLAVLAHPDDESFGSGGTLARYAAEGVDVHIAIATDGAAGSVVSEYEEERERLAHVRIQELEAAVAILGAELHTLNYRDSGYIGDPANEHPEAFINIDEDEVVGRVVGLIRDIQPQVVITHDETGGYFHPDHIMAHKVTTRAFHAAGNAEAYPDDGAAPYQPVRLYYTAMPARWTKVYATIMRLRGQDPTRIGRNQDIDITQVGQPLSRLNVRLNIFPYWEVKRDASAQHRSQGGGGFSTTFPEWLQKRLFNMEYFIRAYPPAENGEIDRDLFEGIDGA